ncbi:MAG: indole-3-glycerol phosphate synthase TrpC [Chloroflexi bacterium]|nr:indole-3-glycerol phosphate synthase TrpC [Chloroflexota bacterium]
MTTGTILDRILDAKRAELERAQRETPLSELQERAKTGPFPLNLSGALWGESVRLIAEVKKASPSKGVIVADYDPAAIAAEYAANGAAAISVLTEADHFQGSLAHLEAVKAVVGPLGLPVLRKDFIFDPYQIFEARAAGADAVLLIVAALADGQLRELLAVAQTIWLQVLVEVHDEAELETALAAGAEIIGVNHRDLRTFEVDLSLSLRLRPLVPAGHVLVAESGIAGAADVRRLKGAGFDAVLVGEALLTAADRPAKVRELAGV